MALRSAVVGSCTAPLRVQCDRRWVMAFSAGLGCVAPAQLDPSLTGGVSAHPLFPVAPEWQVLTGGRAALDYGLEPHEVARGVHAGHDLVLHRPLRSDSTVDISVMVAGVEHTQSGARLTLRFEAVDAPTGQPAWTTWLTSLYRGVSVDGPDRPPVDRPEPTPALERDAQVLDRRSVDIGAGAAHIYTECARIWNPIHTDTEVARSAGLDGIILHGTAALGHGVTQTSVMLGWALADVRRVGGSFRSMVTMPCTLSVELVELTGAQARFQVRTASGDIAIRDGFVDRRP